MAVDKAVQALIKSKGGIQLDIGSGHNKQPGWVGMDIQAFEGVDIVHNFLEYPWPLPDECAIRAIASHVVEHVPPHNFGFINFMNEVWRVMKPDGQFAISMPYATSPGMYQDPTHCNFCNENTWLYFDPLEKKSNGLLYKFYQPKPWRLTELFWDPTGNMEVLLTKRREDRSYYE
ncbi:MAG: class I SAM-dependent methyltransferase [Planctomycetota bacterium]